MQSRGGRVIFKHSTRLLHHQMLAGPAMPQPMASAAGLDLLYGGPVRECYAAPLFVVMLPPLLRGLMVRYDGC